VRELLEESGSRSLKLELVIATKAIPPSTPAVIKVK